MIRWLRLALAVSVGWAGAVLWAYGIAVLQPLCEPGSPWWEMAQNNSYWARDVRWAAILAAVATLIMLRPTVVVAAAGLVWGTADLVLDRVDPGRPALVPAALIAGGLVTVLAVVLWRRPAPDRRWVLARVGLAGLLGSAGVFLLESPSDQEPQLRPSSLAAYLLLALVAVASMLASLPAGAGRRRIGAVLGLGVLSVAAVLIGSVWTSLAWAGVVLSLTLPAVVSVARRPWTGWRPAAAILLTCPVALVGLVVLFALTMLDAARPFTALAGNEPINAADSDPSQVLEAVVVAIAWTLLAKLWSTVTADSPSAEMEQPAQPVQV